MNAKPVNEIDKSDKAGPVIKNIGNNEIEYF